MARHVLCKKADIQAGAGKTFPVAGKKVLVINDGGMIRAYVNFCPHMGGPLVMKDAFITCRWHGATFDNSTGCGLTAPATGSELTPVAVVCEGDDIAVEMEEKPSPWKLSFD